MAAGTVPIAVTQPGTSSLSYTVPANQVLNLQAVRAVFDGTSAASDFLPAVQIVNSNGAVMVQTIGSLVTAGGSADASFFRGIGAGTGTTPGASYPSVVESSFGLWAYWRLGETSPPFHDTSGTFPLSPGDANTVVRGNPYTTHVPGALPPGVDDGALQFNSDTAAGYYLQVTHGALGRYDFGPAADAFSVAGWIKPFTPASGNTAAIISNFYSSPPTGWFFGIDLPTEQLFFMRSSGGTQLFVASTGLTLNAWNHVAATYDGGNVMKLYIGGALVATNNAAASSADVWNNGPQIGGGAPNAGFNYVFPGAIDELALWQVALTPSFIALLASLGA